MKKILIAGDDVDPYVQRASDSRGYQSVFARSLFESYEQLRIEDIYAAVVDCFFPSGNGRVI